MLNPEKALKISLSAYFGARTDFSGFSGPSNKPTTSGANTLTTKLVNGFIPSSLTSTGKI
jgi:hypothetical protein